MSMSDSMQVLKNLNLYSKDENLKRFITKKMLLIGCCYICKTNENILKQI